MYLKRLLQHVSSVVPDKLHSIHFKPGYVEACSGFCLVVAPCYTSEHDVTIDAEPLFELVEEWKLKINEQVTAFTSPEGVTFFFAGKTTKFIPKSETREFPDTDTVFPKKEPVVVAVDPRELKDAVDTAIRLGNDHTLYLEVYGPWDPIALWNNPRVEGHGRLHFLVMFTSPAEVTSLKEWREEQKALEEGS